VRDQLAAVAAPLHTGRRQVRMPGDDYAAGYLLAQERHADSQVSPDRRRMAAAGAAQPGSAGQHTHSSLHPQTTTAGNHMEFPLLRVNNRTLRTGRWLRRPDPTFVAVTTPCQ
jgi:hypothetical protein